MFFYVDAGFDDADPFGFEELFLERGVGFADENLAVGAEDAVPWDAFALRGGAHGAACGACAAGETQGSSEGSISKNPAARNLFHELVNGIKGHRRSAPCKECSISRRATKKKSASSMST